MERDNSERIAMVRKEPPESEPRSRPLPSLFGPRMQMATFFLAGVVLVVANHFYYQYLSGKPVGAMTFQGHHISQEISGAIGNAFAVVTHILFAAAITIGLAQRFWSITRGKPLKVQEIDAIFTASSGNPFLPSSLPSWRIDTPFSVLASMSMIMALVPVIAPGALTVSQSDFFQICHVNNSNVANASLASYYSVVSDTSGTIHLHNPQLPTLSVANRVITSGSYLPPPSPCGVCSYNVTFSGVAMNCSDITTTYDFTSMSSNPPWMDLWHGVASVQNDIGLQVGMQDGNISATRKSALQCTSYAANYSVEVNHGNTASTIYVQSVDVGQKLDATMTPPYNRIQYQLNGLAAAVTNLLSGNITYIPDYCEYASYETRTMASPIAYSPILHQVVDCRGADHSNFQWPDMIKALPSVMENASLSLLSGAYAAGVQDYLTEITTACKVETLTYSYNHLRLLLTYVVAAVLTAICIVAGLRSITANGKEETLGFSRLMHALSNWDLAKAIGNSRDIMKEMVQVDPNGDFKPVAPSRGRQW